MSKSGVFLVSSCRCICFNYISSPVYLLWSEFISFQNREGQKGYVSFILIVFIFSILRQQPNATLVSLPRQYVLQSITRLKMILEFNWQESMELCKMQEVQLARLMHIKESWIAYHACRIQIHALQKAAKTIFFNKDTPFHWH